MRNLFNKFGYLPYAILIQSLIMIICFLSMDTSGGDGGLGAVAFFGQLLIIAAILAVVWGALFVIRLFIPAFKLPEKKEKFNKALLLFPVMIPLSIFLTWGLLLIIDVMDEQIYRYKSYSYIQKRENYIQDLTKNNPSYRFESDGQHGLNYFTPSGYYATADIMSAKGPIHVELDFPDSAKFPNHELATKIMWEAGSIFMQDKSKMLVNKNIRQQKFVIKKDPAYDLYRIYFNPGEKNEILIRYGAYDALIVLEAGTHEAPDY